MRFFLGDFVQLDKARSKLEVPVLRKAVMSDVYLEAPPRSMLVIGTLLNRSVPQPVFLGAQEVRSTIEQALIRGFQGQAPLGNAIAEAQRLGRAKLDEFFQNR